LRRTPITSTWKPRCFGRSAQDGRNYPLNREPTYAQYAAQYEIACEPEHTIPFIPNAALLFLNGLHSWHGQHLTEPMERRTYNSFFTVQRSYRSKALHQQDLICLEKQKLL
jgi:hypothetical protein